MFTKDLDPLHCKLCLSTNKLKRQLTDALFDFAIWREFYIIADIVRGWLIYIHSKSWISWMEKFADDLEFSAEGLSGNAKTIKFSLL